MIYSLEEITLKLTALTKAYNDLIQLSKTYAVNTDSLVGDNPNEFVASASSPITSNSVSLVSSIGAGTSCIYYKGNILTKDSFSPEPVSFVNNDQVVDELCFIFVTYDKGANAFFVNIQNTWTGAIPEPPVGDIENAPTNLVLLLEDAPSGTVENAPTNLVLLEEETAAIENEPTNLVLTEEEI